MNDLISRQAALDAIYHHLPNKTMDECRAMLHVVPSAQPDGDLISRQAVNGIIDALFQNRNNTLIASPLVWHAFREIQNLPSVNNWIPCSERLPEEAYDEYLVSWMADELGEKCCIEVLAYEDEFEFDHEKDRFVGKWLLEEHMKVYTNVRVIAWQPLPEPYEGT